MLGAVLVNPEAYYDVASFLAPDDFFLHRNRWVWDAFNSLHDRRQPMDILTVSEELERQGHLDEAGGPAYLAGLISNVPTSLHAEAYGRLVEESATRRRLLAAANQIARLAYQNETAVEEVVNEAEKAVFGVSERRLTHQLQPIRKVLSDYYDRIDYLARHQDETIGVPTGFVDLDRLLGGMQPSDLLIIAGRPGQGKSGFCLSVAKNASQLHKKHVAVFSLEMSNDQLVQRLIAQETGIDSQRLRMGDIHDEEWPLFTQAVSALGDTHIYLDDTPAITPAAAAHQVPPHSHGGAARPGDRRLRAADDRRLAHRQPRPGSLVHHAQSEGAGARAERARAGRGAALAAPSSSAPTSARCSPTCASPAAWNRTPTWSCSSTGPTSTRPTRSSRIWPRSSSPSTAMVRSAASSWSSAARWPNSRTPRRGASSSAKKPRSRTAMLGRAAAIRRR